MKDSFRSMLKRQVNDLNARLLKKNELAELSDSQHGDPADRTTINRDVLLALNGKIENELLKCYAALERLDAGTYGICTTCGEDISERRLKALPFALRCIECESEHDIGLSGQYAPIRLSLSA